MYYGSKYNYDSNWKLSVSEFVKYLNEEIIKDKRFTNYISKEEKENIINAKAKINDATDLLAGDNYNRLVINTTYDEKILLNLLKASKKISRIKILI